MKVASETDFETTVAARVAGEDIARGDFVTVMSRIVELPSYLWSCTGATLPPDELVRIQFAPINAGQPFKVIGVCLPFVYAKSPRGRVVVIDTRQQQLVRLDKNCARTVWRKMKAPSGKARK